MGRSVRNNHQRAPAQGSGLRAVDARWAGPVGQLPALRRDRGRFATSASDSNGVSNAATSSGSASTGSHSCSADTHMAA
jgi:hypothetical protein